MSILAKLRDLTPRERVDLVAELPADKRDELEAFARAGTKHLPWVPNPGPQTLAYKCEADELFYGGQAGGGKTNLALGLAVTAHRRTLILRRINKDASKLLEHLSDILGHRQGMSLQPPRWRLPHSDGGERLIEFGGCEFEADKQRYKGEPHDLIYFDEGSDFLASQYRFIIGWNRSTVQGQRCRVIVGSNPPTSAEGFWVVRHWAAWLDPLHPHPAKPGELRWYVVGPQSEDVEVEGPGVYRYILGDKKEFLGVERATPDTPTKQRYVARSRTYIPAKLEDNPDQDNESYQGVLSGLPEEIRDAYRDGKFGTSLNDHEYQVIPTEWIEAAQARWRERRNVVIAMTAIGVDVAQGGKDWTVLARRHGGWYDKLIKKPGKETQDGASVASEVARIRRDNCPVIIDVDGGWGGATVENLKGNGVTVVGFKGSGAGMGTTRDNQFHFFNKRTEAWWRFREELDPSQPGGSVIALPPDASIKADLAAPRWHLKGKGIVIEEKKEIKKRLGRSPDEGDAIVMAMSEGSKAAARLMNERTTVNRPERANVGHSEFKQRFR